MSTTTLCPILCLWGVAVGLGVVARLLVPGPSMWTFVLEVFLAGVVVVAPLVEIVAHLAVANDGLRDPEI